MNEKDRKSETQEGASEDAPASGSPAAGRTVQLSLRSTVPFFTVAGVSVRIHVVFIAITIVLGGQALADGANERAFFFPAVLLTLLIHEMGHALAAKRFGQKEGMIVLHPLLLHPSQSAPWRDRRQEAAIALSGPAANAATSLLVALAFCAGNRAGHLSLNPQALFDGGLATRFFAFNLYVFALNLLPVFPFDGGRVLRAMIWGKTGYLVATRMVAAFGLNGGFFLGFLGLYSRSVFVSLLGVLLVSGAIREIYEAPILIARRFGLLSGAAKDADALPLGPGMTAAEAARAVAAKPGYFPVVLGDDILGVIDRRVLSSAKAAYLSGLMTRDMIYVSDTEPLAAILMRGLPSSQRPVVLTSTGTAQGKFVGILSLQSVQSCLIRQDAPVG